MQKYRIKATKVNGVADLGDYMTPEVWDRHYWPSRKRAEDERPWAPRHTLVPVDENGDEIKRSTVT